jgi:hypothetical protein
MQTIYNVSVNPYSVGTSDQTKLGFIDITTVPQYYALAAEPAGFNINKSMAKYQGNLRWKYILQALALMANPYVSNVVATGAAVDTDATNFSFDVYFERDSAVTTVDGSGNILTGIAAVQYVVASALVTAQTHVTEYYDPSVISSVQNGVTIGPFDYDDQRVGPITVGALAANAAAALSNITVTIIA